MYVIYTKKFCITTIFTICYIVHGCAIWQIKIEFKFELDILCSSTCLETGWGNMP